nr:zinc finger, CCHC-type [Tanacetum cinerariifolium]
TTFLFKTYKETKDGHGVMMDDNHTSKVIGSGNMEIQFTSGKKLTLMNVLHVPNTRKNLVSGFKLCKSEVKAVIELDKVIMSKANVFVGKAYDYDGIFKLNINKITSSTYFPDYGSIQTFKARIIIQGFRQRQGVDYFDTYAPVARITSIRVLFALASIYNLHIHQMDVKTAFVNGVLDEEVYMKQPEGFVLPGHKNKVCKLKFDKSILSNGFSHNSSDRCIYSKFKKDYGVILCLYVDDILIVGTNMKGINESKKFMSSCFQMKDMNEVDTILGIKVKRHSGGYALNQCHYIDKIIDKFQHLNIKEANTSYESSFKLVENDGRVVAQLEYTSAIGFTYVDIRNGAAPTKNSLKEKYTAEKEGANKLITFKFFEFAMEDNVSILDQVHEFPILVSKFKNLNIEIPKKLLVWAIITKLPSSWHNYRKKLMHTSEDFTLDQIQKHLRIEEETRIHEKNLNGASSSKVNYVDSRKNNKGNDKKRKGTWISSNDNKKDKKPLSEVVCYKCGEKGHIKRYCKNLKKKNQNSNKKDESDNAVEQVNTTEITVMNGVAERKNKVLQDMINAIAPRRSESATQETNLDPDFIDSQAFIILVKGDTENNVINKIPILQNVEDSPKTYKEAITSRNFAFWNEAIDDEMDSLVSNNTWKLSDLPLDSKAIGCRWVFRIKYYTDRSIQTFKARLVIQGFSQRQGFDYFDAYASVAKITSIYNLPIHQMNVKTAFLNGKLDEEVYMKQPKGFVLFGHENKVCNLKKSYMD